MMMEEVKRAVDHLKRGEVILYPTDTIWGIGCDATNSKAIDKIFRIKKRDEAKSLIILLSDPAQLHNYVESVPMIAFDLIQSIVHPLTIIYPEAKNLPKQLLADDGSIAIRVVKNEFCHEMIDHLGKPVVSTSANLSGDDPPVLYSRISEEIRQGVDYIVNFHRTAIHRTRPSKIIRIDSMGNFSIIRE